MTHMLWCAYEMKWINMKNDISGWFMRTRDSVVEMGEDI